MVSSVPPQYPGLNLELNTEPLPYSGESQGSHLPGEAGAGLHVMMGYEGSFPHPQYNNGYEERHARPSIQWPGYHGHHHGGVEHSQGSPTQRYPYYDSRNGYYSHTVATSQGVTSDPGGGSWHEPVSGSRADSPGPAGAGGPGYPPANSGNMYSCKMQGPPSPQDTKVRREVGQVGRSDISTCRWREEEEEEEEEGVTQPSTRDTPAVARLGTTTSRPEVCQEVTYRTATVWRDMVSPLLYHQNELRKDPLQWPPLYTPA